MELAPWMSSTLAWLGSELANQFPHIPPHFRSCDELKGSARVDICGVNDKHHFDHIYMSKWYLEPERHVWEFILSVVILGPLCFQWYRVCMREMAARVESRTTDFVKNGVAQKVWGIVLLVVVAIQVYIKNSSERLGSHPAYLAQPCHGHCVILAMLSFIDAEWARGLFHITATQCWGPFLALVAPDLPQDPFQIFVFYFQHLLMMLVIWFRINSGARWMYTSQRWNYFGSVLMSCYHYWVLLPVSLYSGINIATMTVPPDALLVLGTHYRIVWACICILLQGLAVNTIKLCAKLKGVYPREVKDADKNGSTKKLK
ncbi:unnamed protein product [Chrysoparadoxa australica]